MASTTNTETMIVFGPEFNPEKDTIFTKPKVNPSGGKNVGILYGPTKKSTYLSTPLMMTWGVNEYTDDSRGTKTYDMALQFPREQDSNYSADTVEFLKSLQAFEAKIKADAITNSKEWMNKTSKQLTPDVVNALWTPMLRYPKGEDGEPDMTKMPTLKIKIPCWEGKWNVEMYDMNENTLFPDPENDTITPLTFIQKNTNVALVIQNGGIWFANGKFGTTWKMVQCVVQPKATLRGKCHIHLGASDKAKLSKAAEDDENSSEVEEISTYAEDSDEEIDQSAIASEVKEEVKLTEIDTPPPKKKIVKKKVVKKVSEEE